MKLWKGEMNFVKLLENEDFKKGFSSALDFMHFHIMEEFKTNGEIIMKDRIDLSFKSIKAIVDLK